ncbi:uncharacterized protein LOC141587895 [Silene latifolia]|uniref:uncharacterized protein LOC141587895 n=1 Tax=Silene latifolia TaxID=37657 RepID=UPI003D76A86C
MQLKHSSLGHRDKNELLFGLQRLGHREQSGCVLTVLQANNLKETRRIFEVSDIYGYYIIGNCNGLLLVRRYGPPCYRKELRLWNPSIRKSLILPANPLPPDLIGDALYMFGFARDSKDYKVVAITFGKSKGDKKSKMYASVYTISDQQWTVRNDGLNIKYSYFENLFGYNNRMFKSIAVYLQGAAHWLGDDPFRNSKQRKKSTHLVSFDFDMEKFNFSELPFASYEKRSSRVLFLLGESLAIFSISSVNSSIRVLENGAWTLRFSGSSSADGHEVFSSLEYEKVFYFESDGGCYINFGEWSYNIASCQVQKLTKSNLGLETYSESLVLHKRYGAKDLISFP